MLTTSLTYLIIITVVITNLVIKMKEVITIKYY